MGTELQLRPKPKGLVQLEEHKRCSFSSVHCSAAAAPHHASSPQLQCSIPSVRPALSSCSASQEPRSTTAQPHNHADPPLLLPRHSNIILKAKKWITTRFCRLGGVVAGLHSACLPLEAMGTKS